MTAFFQKIFTRYPIKTRRGLELLPGTVSWTLILFPVWGSFLIPYIVAYFILFFDVYWFYKSFSLAINAYVASKKIKNAEQMNWLKKLKELSAAKKVKHVVIIPNYKENLSKLRQTIKSIASQTLSTKQIFVVLGMEKREEDGMKKANSIIREFKNTFGDIFATYHPDIETEVKGKSSNESYASKKAYFKLIKTGIIDINFTTISSVDADSVFDKQYFSYLSYEFLTDSKRYNKFWQSANVNHNNFWTVPAPIRVIAFFGSLWRTALLTQKDRLITNSTYSLSFLLLKRIGFWDTDVIPEDYRIFFKAFYELQGKVWVEPIFLKTSMDAPLSSGYIKSLKNKYQQERRWSWGASDDQLYIKWWFTIPNVPFMRKTIMLYNVLLDHFLWPVNWFIITVAANIMPLINPVFQRTTLGYSLPKLAGLILTSCLVALIAMVIIDFKNRPKNPSISRLKEILFPLQLLLLPIVGFFLSTLPALISHTQLLRGKRLEYKVTEKL
ncbi:MAG: glycosyltransferase family 2 protein [Candidatus Levybacteria bacterium]|nr:glycosyltransferase family 2 protein [Candidatus Levybacteria bacterium]MDZ4227944.1 glycosyltransferase family 2 protein [Candidatus Levybacteria bacterium]